MSKVKKSGPLKYEILYIVSNELSEQEVEKISEQINKIIEDSKAVIINAQSLGKRQLAYQIQKYNHGYYNLAVFESAGENVAKIDRLVRQMREILRYCIVRHVPKRIIPSGISSQESVSRRGGIIEKAKETKEETKIETPKSADIEEKPVIETVKTETKEAQEKEEVKKEEKKEEKEIKEEAPKEDLDKKLDDILEAKNLF